MTTEQIKTPYAVHCPVHGLRYLTRDQYAAQMVAKDATWRCPESDCGKRAWWDDAIYEAAVDADELDEEGDEETRPPPVYPWPALEAAAGIKPGELLVLYGPPRTNRQPSSLQEYQDTIHSMGGLTVVPEQFKQTVLGEYHLHEKRYNEGGRLRLDFLSESGEPLATLTTNLPNEKLGPDEFFAKTWSENADVAAICLASGLFIDTGRRVTTGCVEAQVWRFANEPEEVAAYRRRLELAGKFNAIGTTTGRLSASKPNLSNARKTER